MNPTLRLPSALCPPSRRHGFTLVEMLITITIIGILAAGVLAALQGARETAKAAKTKATITKLHYVIMARYDSYRTRRVPLDVKQYVQDHFSFYASYKDPMLAYAHARLMALRDLMRMEMPDRWSDVYRLDKNNQLIPPQLVLQDQPSISKRYFRTYEDALKKIQQRVTAGEITAKEADDTLQEWGAAECLYMIVMSIPEAAEQMQNAEIGDFDGDGLNEFIDGWGHPIRFIRWPVGFIAPDAISDLQDSTTHDPFDPQNLFPLNYALFPLIYSAGPDGLFDINIGRDGTATYAYILDSSGNLNPYKKPDGSDIFAGKPEDSDSYDGTPLNNELDHYDNIHNHRLEVR